MALPRAARLAQRRRIGEVRRTGRRSQSAAGSLWVLPAAGSESRLAIAVPRRLGCAVVRNRLRRRLQAHFRVCSAAWHQPWDIYFLAREAIMGETFEQLGVSFQHLLRQARVH